MSCVSKVIEESRWPWLEGFEDSVGKKGLLNMHGYFLLRNQLSGSIQRKI